MSRHLPLHSGSPRRVLPERPARHEEFAVVESDDRRLVQVASEQGGDRNDPVRAEVPNDEPVQSRSGHSSGAPGPGA